LRDPVPITPTLSPHVTPKICKKEPQEHTAHNTNKVHIALKRERTITNHMPTHNTKHTKHLRAPANTPQQTKKRVAQSVTAARARATAREGCIPINLTGFRTDHQIVAVDHAISAPYIHLHRKLHEPLGREHLNQFLGPGRSVMPPGESPGPVLSQSTFRSSVDLALLRRPCSPQAKSGNAPTAMRLPFSCTRARARFLPN
jgi:hypothetical protein